MSKAEPSFTDEETPADSSPGDRARREAEAKAVEHRKQIRMMAESALRSVCNAHGKP
jgi:hypothetical protein